MKTNTIKPKGVLTALPLALAFTSLGAASSLAQLSSLPGVANKSGQVQLINPPLSVLLQPTNKGIPPLENDSFAFLFLEKENFVLTSDVGVDITVPALYNFNNPDPTPSILATGTALNSYFLNVNPVGTIPTPSRREKTYTGSITFAQEILGLAFQEDTIAASDQQLGNPTTLYLPSTGNPDLGSNFSITLPNGRVIPRDSFALSSDRKTFTFNFIAGEATDQIRIITQQTPVSVPERLSIADVFTALGFGLLLKRKQAKKSEN
jgi:hypothetical protein